MSLTDEQIRGEEWRLTAEREYENWTGAESLVVDGVADFARAIESAATAPLLEQIKDLERQLEQARQQMESQKDEWLAWEAKRVALEKDAARYRKWRSEYVLTTTNATDLLHVLADAWDEPAVDAAIDAAIKESK